jgi:hypothetical protein
MVGIIGECAHISCPHIKQVLGIAGVISEAAPDVGPLFDQRHAKIGAWLLQQLIGQQDAASAPADDDRASRGGTVHAACLLARCDRGRAIVAGSGPTSRLIML